MEHADSDTNIKQSKSNHLAWSEGFDLYDEFKNEQKITLLD